MTGHGTLATSIGRREDLRASHNLPACTPTAVVDSRSVSRRLEARGWYLVRSKGSHWHFRHPERPGIVTVPHPVRELPLGTLRSIERQSGVRLRPER